MNPFENRFAGKVAVVTGAASGIGYAIAKRLVQEGASVLAADLNTERLDAIQGELGERFFGVKANVTVENDIEEMVSAAVKQFGKLDLAFNVAGASRAGERHYGTIGERLGLHRGSVHERCLPEHEA
ncbi:NAD(P)-dependent dehydrogenase (short-subunit alcohol dehydrogenase family) [Paenibacillus sp. PvP094]|uniref:SDR family NAD(P)-dependent oxidoreductase n=1 Tax=Paenibacillus sp. PvP094 TaxID=3156394 RepID=UPI0033918B79